MDRIINSFRVLFSLPPFPHASFENNDIGHGDVPIFIFVYFQMKKWG